MNFSQLPDYVQPVAQHLRHPERLLVRGHDGQHYLWRGDASEGWTGAIEPGLTEWLLSRAELQPLDLNLWFHRDDLPLTPATIGPVSRSTWSRGAES